MPKKRKKRSQLSLFILFGIIILIAFGFLFYLKATSIKKIGKEVEENIYSGFQPIKLYVEECVNQAGENAIILTGLQGGVYDYDKSLTTYYSSFPYAYYNGKNIFMTKKEMEDLISSYTIALAEECLNLSIFEEKGYEIEAEESVASAIIKNDSVFIKVEKPLSIKKGSAVTKISDFTATLDVRLGHIYDIINGTANKMVKDNGWIDFTFMSNFDVNYSIQPYKKDILIFVIKDPKSIINNAPFSFIFANKFIEKDDFYYSENFGELEELRFENE